MVAAAPSGSESVDKACTTQLSLHRGAAPMKLTAFDVETASRWPGDRGIAPSILYTGVVARARSPAALGKIGEASKTLVLVPFNGTRSGKGLKT